MAVIVITQATATRTLLRISSPLIDLNLKRNSAFWQGGISPRRPASRQKLNTWAGPSLERQVRRPGPAQPQHQYTLPWWCD